MSPVELVAVGSEADLAARVRDIIQRTHRAQACRRDDAISRATKGIVELIAEGRDLPGDQALYEAFAVGAARATDWYSQHAGTSDIFDLPAAFRAWRQPALAVGDTVTTEAELASLPIGAVLRDATNDLAWLDDENTWRVAGIPGMGDTALVDLPARVLDLPEATS